LKIGVAMRGAGVNGAVGIGVINALEELGLSPNVLCASGGEIPGVLIWALIAIGADKIMTVEPQIKGEVNIGKAEAGHKSDFTARPVLDPERLSGSGAAEYCRRCGYDYIMSNAAGLIDALRTK